MTGVNVWASLFGTLTHSVCSNRDTLQSSCIALGCPTGREQVETLMLLSGGSNSSHAVSRGLHCTCVCMTALTSDTCQYFCKHTATKSDLRLSFSTNCCKKTRTRGLGMVGGGVKHWSAIRCTSDTTALTATKKVCVGILQCTEWPIKKYH